MFVWRSIAALLFLCCCCAAQRGGKPPVLVELFTSEGCSSCPPADALLARLQREQPVSSAAIVILEEHVDYWDSLGWHDRFSSAGMTDRQHQYGKRFSLSDVYTPQMVVGGQFQFEGSDSAAATKAIAQAARTPQLTLTVTDIQLAVSHVSAKVTASAPRAQTGDVFAALVASSTTTDIRSGENAGRTLHHAGVVLAMTRIGSLHDPDLTLDLDTPTPEKGLHLVVFAQERAQGPILGVASLAVPRPRPPALGSPRK